ncbi:unnamed protein product [Phaeothamnion confervicola]
MYTSVTRILLQQLQAHPLRVADPADARLFVVPFDVDSSHTIWRRMKSRGKEHCAGTTHLERLASAIAALRASPLFQAHGGADHFWPIGSYRLWYAAARWEYFPVDSYPVLSRMAIGRYMDPLVHASEVVPMPETEERFQEPWFKTLRAYWRCTVVMPTLAHVGLFQEDESFEQWQQRKIGFFFRGKNRECHDRHAAVARNETLRLAAAFPDGVFGDSHAGSYEREVRDARFCLVLACDDPQTSRFWDAMSAGCLPVVVNEGFRLAVAPFTEFVNYDSFLIELQVHLSSFFFFLYSARFLGEIGDDAALMATGFAADGVTAGASITIFNFTRQSVPGHALPQLLLSLITAAASAGRPSPPSLRASRNPSFRFVRVRNRCG